MVLVRADVLQGNRPPKDLDQAQLAAESAWSVWSATYTTLVGG